MSPRRRVGHASLLATFAIVACTHRHYDGPAVPPSERSMVEGEWHYYVVGGEGIHLTSIDGQQITSAKKFEVMPGRHVISARFWSQYANYREEGARDCLIAFDAVAGHDYRVEYEAADLKWSAWLVDTSTGERVTNCVWPEAPISWTPIEAPAPTPTAHRSDSPGA